MGKEKGALSLFKTQSVRERERKSFQHSTKCTSDIEDEEEDG